MKDGELYCISCGEIINLFPIHMAPIYTNTKKIKYVSLIMIITKYLISIYVLQNIINEFVKRTLMHVIWSPLEYLIEQFFFDVYLKNSIDTTIQTIAPHLETFTHVSIL